MQALQAYDSGVGPETLGERIRRLRHERGLSLAKVCGEDFSRAFLNQVELGRSQPSTRVLRVIAGRLGTQVDYLLDGRLPALDRELSLERARVLLLRGHAQRALTALGAAGEAEWPLGTDARLCRAAALAKLNRHEEARELLATERSVIAAHRDHHRMARWRALWRGETFVFGGGDSGSAAEAHLRLADRAVRTGDASGALEHYRAARVLMEI
jgi:transcriptional regulator with XRE-family HTH domain